MAGILFWEYLSHTAVSGLSHMHDRKGQWNGLSVEKKKIIAHSYFSAKRSSVALMSCSHW